MTPDEWRQVTAVFHDALEREPDARPAFLDDACARTPAIRTEVERLLAAHRRAEGFGEVPVVANISATASSLAPTSPQEELSELDSSAAEEPAPRRHPFTWIVWAASLVTVATFAYVTWLLIVTGASTRIFGWDEARRRGEWLITSVDPQGPAAGRLEVGDRLIGMNGVPPFGRGGTGVHRRQLWVGEIYQVSIERQGARMTQTLTLAEGPRDLSISVTYFLVSLVWCVVGLFIGLARPEHAVARLAFGAAMTTGLGYLTTALLQIGGWFHPLHVVLGVHFFSRFPNLPPLTGVWKWTLAVAYVVAMVPITLAWTTHITLLAGGVAAVGDLITANEALFALRGPVPLYLFYASLVGMVGAAAYNYRRFTEEDQRRRVRWVAFGSIASLTPQVVLSVAEIAGAAPTIPWLGRVADGFSAGIPIAVAYAVVKHRVFDIRVVIRRGVQYILARGALQALVTVPAVALVYTVIVNRQQTVARLVTENTGYLYWIALAGLAFRFRQPLRLWLDRRFFREEYDRERLLLGLLDDLGAVDSVSRLSELVSAKLESALHPAGVYFWYRDPGEFASASSSNPQLTPPDFPADGPWLGWLHDQATAVDLPLPRDAGLLRHQARWLAARSVSLAIPITDSSEALAGVLLLGPKKSEELYTASDRRLLLAIAKQAAVVRENLRLRAQVSDEQRVRHDVLARLDRQHVDLLKECPLCGRCYDGPTERCDRDGAALTLSLPVARIVDRKYRLDLLIGKGGMGAVYEACDLRLDRVVAVKILRGRAFGEQTALRRFRREARAAARLNHPRIVRVFDYGALEGEGAYIVMERLHGATLRAELERVKTMPLADAAVWFEQILDGLAAAHHQGIVHRDLKPENIVGSREHEGRLAVTILDFGLAKEVMADALTTGVMTVEGVVMGTLGYMSPEQLLGRPVDHRTDIFAMGVMLAEAITGRRPFSSDTQAEASRAVLNDTYRLPGLTPGDRAIDQVLQRCLAKEPSGRYDSASVLRHELIPLLRSIGSAGAGGVA